MSGVDRVGIAFLGCGYASDFYGATLPNYPHLLVKGAFDPRRERAETFVDEYGGRVYEDFAAVLADPGVSVVVNLTPVTDHYRTTKAALLAGKHVYSEKPLASDLDEARELVELAEERGLLLSSAPSTVFSQSAQTLLKAVEDGLVGRPLLVHAALDMGALAFMSYDHWRSKRGVPWPYEDEVRNGCVMEHAGYQLSWLVAMFGPVKRMTGHTATLLSQEWAGLDRGEVAPDVSLGFLEFASGAVCRISIGWVAPRDQSLVVIGDRGTLSVADVWQASCPVVLRRRVPTSGKDHEYLGEPVELPFVVPPTPHHYDDTHDLTVGAGVSDLALALLEGREPFLSAAYSLHVLDVSLRLASGRGVSEEVPIRHGGDVKLSRGLLEPAGAPRGLVPVAREGGR
ncbi:Gfo/Idh/MocA family protein [Saccharothrix syringae]|uniref:Gfo/Idh/MocA family protein n=1 Tax=Saccharothrix syringae TaxID=103733 RepID=UPI00068C99FA|nr:Gfo/Idh/MocA family oxidoreductase [Saccharothrix syringae]